jgi:hypothetical protein
MKNQCDGCEQDVKTVKGGRRTNGRRAWALEGMGKSEQKVWPSAAAPSWQPIEGAGRCERDRFQFGRISSRPGRALSALLVFFCVHVVDEQRGI